MKLDGKVIVDRDMLIWMRDQFISLPPARRDCRFLVYLEDIVNQDNTGLVAVPGENYTPEQVSIQAAGGGDE